MARPSSLRQLRCLRVGLRQRAAKRVKPASRAQSVQCSGRLRFAPARDRGHYQVSRCGSWHVVAIQLVSRIRTANFEFVYMIFIIPQKDSQIPQKNVESFCGKKFRKKTY